MKPMGPLEVLEREHLTTPLADIASLLERWLLIFPSMLIDGNKCVVVLKGNEQHLFWFCCCCASSFGCWAPQLNFVINGYFINELKNALFCNVTFCRNSAGRFSMETVRLPSEIGPIHHHSVAFTQKNNKNPVATQSSNELHTPASVVPYSCIIISIMSS